MDAKLVAWARAVKSRNRWRDDAWLPVLWVFTDDARLPDPLMVLPHLPPGLCGVVLRSRNPIAAKTIRTLACHCRARRVVLVVAGARRGTATTGVHLGRRAGLPGRRCVVTASAHGAADLMRAARSGADAVFLSPVFPTSSHRGRPGLGVIRWAALANTVMCRAFALGGVSGRTVTALPRWCRGAGVIDAALPERRV